MNKFKDYVHNRLDEMGVPADPEPEQNKLTGCRIDGRLNFVQRHLKRFKTLEQVGWRSHTRYEGVMCHVRTPFGTREYGVTKVDSGWAWYASHLKWEDTKCDSIEKGMEACEQDFKDTMYKLTDYLYE